MTHRILHNLVKAIESSAPEAWDVVALIPETHPGSCYRIHLRKTKGPAWWTVEEDAERAARGPHCTDPARAHLGKLEQRGDLRLLVGLQWMPERPYLGAIIAAAELAVRRHNSQGPRP